MQIFTTDMYVFIALLLGPVVLGWVRACSAVEMLVHCTETEAFSWIVFCVRRAVSPLVYLSDRILQATMSVV